MCPLCVQTSSLEKMSVAVLCASPCNAHTHTHACKYVYITWGIKRDATLDATTLCVCVREKEDRRGERKEMRSGVWRDGGEDDSVYVYYIYHLVHLFIYIEDKRGSSFVSFTACDTHTHTLTCGRKCSMREREREKTGNDDGKDVE